MPKASTNDGIDTLVKKAVKARTAKEANAIIDKLARFGEDAAYALEDVVDQTKFDAVKAHGLQVIRDVKSEDTKY